MNRQQLCPPMPAGLTEEDIGIGPESKLPWVYEGPRDSFHIWRCRLTTGCFETTFVIHRAANPFLDPHPSFYLYRGMETRNALEANTLREAKRMAEAALSRALLECQLKLLGYGPLPGSASMDSPALAESKAQDPPVLRQVDPISPDGLEDPVVRSPDEAKQRLQELQREQAAGLPMRRISLEVAGGSLDVLLLRPRVWGPKPHGRGYRLYFRRNGKTCATPTVPTPEDGEKLKRALLREMEAQEELTLEEAFAQYENFLRSNGNNKSASVRGTLQRLRYFFPRPELSLRRLSRRECAELYQRLVKEPRKATGRPLAADSHRNYLAEAKTFLKWCVGQGWLKESPLAGVQGQGRRRHGKAQLGIDESRKLSAVAFERAGAGDIGALAVLICLHLRMRASELTHLQVRTVPCGADESRTRGLLNAICC